MLRTNKQFRFVNQNSGCCIASTYTVVKYLIPEGYVFDATQDYLSKTILLSDAASVRDVYRVALQRQLLLWTLVLFGGALAAMGVSVVGFTFCIPYIAVCAYFGDYILCIPNGRMCDAANNVLHADGCIAMKGLPDTYIFVKGTDKYERAISSLQ